MKKLFIITALMLTANLSAQNIKFDTGTHDPILITSDTGNRIKVKIELSGKIEIYGHVFENKKSKDPIIYEADISEIKIYNSKGNYQKRYCSESKCDILHLEAKSYGTSILGSVNTLLPNTLLPNIYQNNTLELTK